MAFGEDKRGIGNERRSRRSHDRRVLEVLADPYLESVWKMYSRARHSLPYEERMLNLTWRIMSMKSKRPGMKNRQRGVEEEARSKGQDVGADGGWCEDGSLGFLSIKEGHYRIEEEKRVGRDLEHASSGFMEMQASLFGASSGVTTGKAGTVEGLDELAGSDHLLQNMLTHIEGYGTELVLYKAEAGAQPIDMEPLLRGSPRPDNGRELLVEPTMLIGDTGLSSVMIDCRRGKSSKENGLEQSVITGAHQNTRKPTQTSKCVRKKSPNKVHPSLGNFSVSAFSVPEGALKDDRGSPNKSSCEQEQRQVQEVQQQQSATSSKANIHCTNCRTKTTPLWRRDPHGNPLCNACGLFLKLHGVVRPLSLKTDVIKKRQRSSNRNTNGTAKNSSESPKSTSSSPVRSFGSERRRTGGTFQISRRKSSTVRRRESFTVTSDLKTISKDTVEPLCLAAATNDKKGLEGPLGTASDDIYSSFSSSMQTSPPAKFPESASLGVLSSGKKMETREEQAQNMEAGGWEWLTLSL